MWPTDRLRKEDFANVASFLSLSVGHISKALLSQTVCQPHWQSPPFSAATLAKPSFLRLSVSHIGKVLLSQRPH